MSLSTHSMNFKQLNAVLCKKRCRRLRGVEGYATKSFSWLAYVIIVAFQISLWSCCCVFQLAIKWLNFVKRTLGGICLLVMKTYLNCNQPKSGHVDIHSHWIISDITIHVFQWQYRFLKGLHPLANRGKFCRLFFSSNSLQSSSGSDFLSTDLLVYKQKKYWISVDRTV